MKSPTERMLAILNVIRRFPDTPLNEAARMCRVPRKTAFSWKSRNTRGFGELLEAAKTGGGFAPNELPSIETAVTSADWLNMADQVWPGVMAELVEINSGEYDQVLLMGGISSGKTFTAAISLVYQLLKILIRSDPHKDFGLSDRSPILLAVQNRTAKLAKHNDYAVVRSIIENAPVFQQRFPHERRLKDRIKFVGKNVEIWAVGGDPNSVLGMNLHSLVLDEVNFFDRVERSTRSVDGNPFDAAFEAYETAIGRKQTRFPAGQGMFFVASSKRYQGQFTDRLQRAHADDPRTYVFQHTPWSIRPDAYPEKRFSVFVGDQSRPARVLSVDEAVDVKDRDLVIRVPDTENLRRRFQGNLTRALQDIAGISTEQIAGFFRNKEKLNDAACLGNLFKRADADLALHANELLHDSYHTKEVDNFWWAHCDLSLSRDKTGIALGKIADYVLAGDLWVPVIKVPFLLRVHPPKHGQIELDAVRRVLFELADSGVPIKWVSFDGFQSADLMQRCAKRFFVHKISTDQTKPDDPIAAMECLRTAVEEQRVKFAYDQKLIGELLSLKHDQKKNRVDHPPQGAKDTADALAGVVYGLTKFVKPTDIGRFDIWSQNIQPGELKSMLTRVTRIGSCYDSAYHSDSSLI